MCEKYQTSPDRYKGETPDNDNKENLNNLYETAPEQSPQNLQESLPKNNTEPLEKQNTPKTPNESASTQKLPLIDNELQNHLTVHKKPVATTRNRT